MNISTINKTIKRFWKNENHSDVYYLGLCSEFAIALKRFLNSGTIYKAGHMHTCLKYKDHYCDIRGCYPKSKYRSVAPSLSLLPATKSEIQHINNLLEKDTVKKILSGLKKAQKDVK